MNTVLRPMLRSIVVRNTPLAIRPIARPIRLGVTATVLQARTVASSVSMRPASQTLEHAATNVKEELGNSAADLAKVISGANVTTDSVSDTESFVSIGVITVYLDNILKARHGAIGENHLICCSSSATANSSPWVGG